MANINQHTKKSLEFFGDASLGEDFQKLLDENRSELSYHHRKIDHDFERLLAIGEEYGEQGLKEIILHLCMDYKLLTSATRFISTLRREALSAVFFGKDNVKETEEALQAVIAINQRALIASNQAAIGALPWKGE